MALAHEPIVVASPSPLLFQEEGEAITHGENTGAYSRADS